MNNALLSGKVKAIGGVESPVYILEDKSQFSVTEYKVMENLVSLMKCIKATLNGDIELVYIRGKARPLNSVMGQLNDEQIARVIRSFLDALVEISSNGFLQSNDLVVSMDKVFLDQDELAVRLIYLPVNIGYSDGGVNVREANDFILSILEKAGNADSSLLSAIKVFCYSNKETSIESSRNLYVQLMQQYSIEEKTEEPDEKLILSFKDGEEERSFVVGSAKYTIGFKEGSADGLIRSNKFISSPHCEITREDGKWYITDLDSTNGTFVNGRRLERYKRTELKDSDAIRLANSTLFAEVRRGQI